MGILIRWCAIVCALICSTGAIARAQHIGDWTFTAPPDSVRLVSVVEGPAPDTFTYTFQNLTDKTIVEFRVTSPNGTTEGPDGFLVGLPAGLPKGLVTVRLGASDFVTPTRVVHHLIVSAIVYSDGSRVGDKRVLKEVEDEMVGAALELKRDSDIITKAAQENDTSYDSLLKQLGTQLPSSPDDVRAALGDIGLAGVPHDFLDTHLKSATPSFISGARTGRQLAFRELRLASGETTSTPESSGHGAIETEKVAGHFRERSSGHVKFLNSYVQGRAQ
jgi:hypothetical protein